MEQLLNQIKAQIRRQDDPDLLALVQQLEQQIERNSFIAARLRKDLDMTVRYLDKTISELELRNQELEEIADRRFRDIFENTLDGILIYDYTKQKILAINPAFLATFNYTEATFPRHNTSALFTNFQTNGQHSQEYVEEHRDQVIKTRKAHAFDLLCKRDNGEQFEAAAMFVPNTMDTSLLYLVIRDISGEKKAEQALQAQKQELERYIESNMELENFAYIASHDLKAPIRGIVSFTNLLRRSLGDWLTNRQEEYLSFIETNALSMHELITALLDYSRVNRQKNKFEEINIRQLLERLRHEFTPLLEEKNGIIQIGEMPSKICLDALKIRQVFHNLIANAIKFVPQDKEPVIKIDGYSDNTHYYFSVQDNGIGIRAEFQQNIFLIFKRLHTQTEYTGTGIGLAICKKVVEQHNGTIWVDSIPGRESTFTFSIAKTINCNAQITTSANTGAVTTSRSKAAP